MADPSDHLALLTLLKAAYISLRANIEQWVNQYLDDQIGVVMVLAIFSRLQTPTTEGKISLRETFDIYTREEQGDISGLVNEFKKGCCDAKLFVYLWIMKLLNEHFFQRYLPLGFTKGEEAMIHEVRYSLLDNSTPKGEPSVCSITPRMLDCPTVHARGYSEHFPRF